MRPAFARLAQLALVCALVGPAAVVHAQSGDRFAIAVVASKNIHRLHAIDADTLGLSYRTGYSGAVLVDFRVLDLPMGKGPLKPALHLTGGVTSDQFVLGPAIAGQRTDEFQVIEFASGVALELPLDVLLAGNAGVGLRLGWEGSYLLTRAGGQRFLERSKARLDFVRTTGGLQGSSIGVGMGRDETFGYDASGGRWDVRASLQGRVWGAQGARAAATPVRPGTKPAAPGRAPADGRLVWIFADIGLDTDGGAGADGLRARVGVGLDVNAFATAVFTPLRL